MKISYIRFIIEFSWCTEMKNEAISK